jgi:hypothetical protein
MQAIIGERLWFVGVVINFDASPEDPPLMRKSFRCLSKFIAVMVLAFVLVKGMFGIALLVPGVVKVSHWGTLGLGIFLGTIALTPSILVKAFALCTRRTINVLRESNSESQE